MPRDAHLLDHSYDGIQEYDNPTPGWWWWIFNLCVAFSLVYFVVFHLGSLGWTNIDEHDSAVARIALLQFGDTKLALDDATILDAMANPNYLAIGKATFKGKCVQCHLPDGSGSVGPNMTDDHYKNVKVLSDIARVITNGAASNAMPSWRTQLSQNEIVVTAAYIASLRGQNLPGKAAEGEAIPPWPKPAASAPASGGK